MELLREHQPLNLLLLPLSFCLTYLPPDRPSGQAVIRQKTHCHGRFHTWQLSLF